MRTHRPSLSSAVNLLRGGHSTRSPDQPRAAPSPRARRVASGLGRLAYPRPDGPVAVGPSPDPACSAIALLSGVIGAGLLPRYVTTVGEMFGLMFGGLLVGAAVAVVLRSRWAILLAPIGHIIGFEVARALVFGAPGLFERWHLSRQLDGDPGVHRLPRRLRAPRALPMVLGAILGAAGVRRAIVGAPGRCTGSVGSAVHAARAGTALLAVGARRDRRAVRAACLDAADSWPGRHVLPGSIATLQQVRLGGTDQWVADPRSQRRQPGAVGVARRPGDAGDRCVAVPRRLEEP